MFADIMKKDYIEKALKNFANDCGIDSIFCLYEIKIGVHGTLCQFNLNTVKSAI